MVSEIEQLQANVVALEKRGGKIVMNTCGKRLCIAASPDQGTNETGRLMSLGSWTLSDGTPLVIPKGY